MKSFKQFIKEENDQTTLSAGVVKSINMDLFKLVQKDDKTSDIKEMFATVQEVLSKHGLTMVNESGEIFKPEVIVNKKETFVDLANANAQTIQNVVVNVEWNIFDGEYALKDCSLQERK